MRNVVLLVLIVIITPINILAQDNLEEVLTFTDEVTRMAVDPAGRIYIVSPAGGKIIVYDPSTQEKTVYGGLGSSNSLFDTPTDIDPTNGLVIYVADAGRQKVLRFSHEMRLQEQFSATESTTLQVQTNNFGRENIFQDDEISYSPEYLSVTETGQIFALDINQNNIISWRNTGEFISNPIGNVIQIQDPIDLQVGGSNQLYVADREASGIYIFDHLGNYKRTLAGGSLHKIQALGWHFNQLWVIQTNVISIFDPSSGLIAELTLPKMINDKTNNKTTVLDALPINNFIYWLTPNQLFRQELRLSKTN